MIEDMFDTLDYLDGYVGHIRSIAYGVKYLHPDLAKDLYDIAHNMQEKLYDARKFQVKQIEEKVAHSFEISKLLVEIAFNAAEMRAMSKKNFQP